MSGYFPVCCVRLFSCFVVSGNLPVLLCRVIYLFVVSGYFPVCCVGLFSCLLCRVIFLFCFVLHYSTIKSEYILGWKD